MAADASRICPLGRLRLLGREEDGLNQRVASAGFHRALELHLSDFTRSKSIVSVWLWDLKNRSRLCLTDVMCWLVHGRPLPAFIQGARESSMEIKKLEVSIERKPSIEIDSDAPPHHHIGFYDLH